MATVDLVASEVMDGVSALMNNVTQTVYGYAAQLPYLRIASQELQEKFQLNSIPVSETSTSDAIEVDAGINEIIFNGVGVPSLPDDLIEPKQLWERNRGIDPYIPMTKLDFIPHDLAPYPTSNFTFWVWQDQKIKLIASSVDNDIKMDYVKTLFPKITDEDSLINVINAQTFLEFRTAALICQYIERNITSAQSLNAEAILAMDRALGIGVKGKQAIQTRRRPFRSGWKRRTGGVR